MMKIYLSGYSWEWVIDKIPDIKHIMHTYNDLMQGKYLNRLNYPDIMLDSGAFSNETGIGQITLYSYTKWLLENLEKYPQITTYVCLDDISSWQKSQENQDYMESCGLNPLPVFHYGEPENVLEGLCKRYQYIGIGGYAINKLQAKEIQTNWEFIAKSYPGHKFHLFGVGSMKPLVNIRPYSLDTTAWLSGAKFGWKHILVTKNGIPTSLGEVVPNNSSIQMYLDGGQMIENNIKALLEWEKEDWVSSIKPQAGEQHRMF